MESKDRAKKVSEDDKKAKESDGAHVKGAEDSNDQDQERNGIIPEDLDLKKFMGCGG